MFPPNQQLAAPGKWPVVGEKKPRVSNAPWYLSIDGLVAKPTTWSFEEICSLPQRDLSVDIHCVTGWSKPGTTFSGVPLAYLLEQCNPLPEARFLSFMARSERNHSTSLLLEDALELGAFIALAYEGEPLEPIHGGPVRVVTPGRYFYKSVKWLERIELLAEDRLGYWEDVYGYHNNADPWRDERFIEQTPDKALTRMLFEKQDFSGQNVLNLDARGREFKRFKARNAQLRHANFTHVSMPGASFEEANLSLARLCGADLRGASFVNADVEGADFRGADLRGADFTGTWLAAVKFCSENDAGAEEFGPAQIDSSTRIDEDSLERLTSDIQKEFVRRALRGD